MKHLTALYASGRRALAASIARATTSEDADDRALAEEADAALTRAMRAGATARH